MRRLAAELDAGTMTLYHYVRTKDELLTLVVDAFLGEVVVPADQRLPREWRAAITLIVPSHARRPSSTSVDPRHHRRPQHRAQRDASLRSVVAGARRHSRRSFEDKLDLITLVDEYVFGYLLARAQQSDATTRVKGRWSTTSAPCSSTTSTRRWPAWSKRWGCLGCGRASTLTHAAAGGSTATSPDFSPASRPACHRDGGRRGVPIDTSSRRQGAYGTSATRRALRASARSRSAPSRSAAGSSKNSPPSAR